MACSIRASLMRLMNDASTVAVLFHSRNIVPSEMHEQASTPKR